MLWTPICISTCLWDRSGQWGITWWRNTILPSIGCSKSLPLIDYYRLGLVMIFPYAPQALQESQALWESLACLVGCLLFSNPCWSQQHLSGSYCANRRVHSAAVLSCEVRSLRYCCAMLPTSGSSAISPQPPSLSKYQTIMHSLPWLFWCLRECALPIQEHRKGTLVHNQRACSSFSFVLEGVGERGGQTGGSLHECAQDSFWLISTARPL
jgi:hypothetical protein